MESLASPFELPFVQRGLLEVLLLSIGTSLLGTWIVLRGLAFYSHAVGTAAFPGLVLADGLGFGAPLGAFGAALVFAVSLERLGRRRRSGYDSLTALVLAGALALGVILASDVFRSSATVESLLFGSLLLIEPRDLVIAAAASAVAAIATVSLGRAWLATGFDPSGARALGVRSPASELLLLVVIALTVIASVSAVGALLVTAVLVTPAATVRIWTNRLSTWRAGTVALTALEGTAGLWLSVKTNAPPGATIAVLAGGAFALAAVTRVLASSARRRAATSIAAAAVVGLAFASCGGDPDAGGTEGGKVEVVATTTQIGDWAREIGGDAVDVHQILKANSDPHEYELRPGDVESTAGADIVLRNGDNLDPWTDELVDEAGGDPAMLDLGAVVPERLAGKKGGAEASRYDAHWWHDPRNATEAVSAIRDAFIRASPRNRGTFERNARVYRQRLRRLDSAIRACIDRVPVPERKLVTDHDAFGYFARRYRIRVVGAVIPSQTTEAQPSAGELARLGSVIKRERVRAVFPESSLNTKLVKAIATQAGASSAFTLYGDTLGPAGSRGDTYLGMLAANAETIARGLSGGRVRCSIQTG